MDTDQAPLSDASAEDDDATLDEATWLDDVGRYYQDDRPAPRQPDEFSRKDWEEHRHHANTQAAQRDLELQPLIKRGVLTRRSGIIDGRRGWLYRFVK